jgi:hypothetical protein
MCRCESADVRASGNTSGMVQFCFLALLVFTLTWSRRSWSRQIDLFLSDWDRRLEPATVKTTAGVPKCTQAPSGSDAGAIGVRAPSGSQLLIGFRADKLGALPVW